jgi:hypothetical protein
MDTTRVYYRVGAQRQREAVDKVTRHQFDRHGKGIWREAEALLDAERARRAVGQVAVPYSTCNEPTNVQAGGGACPFRFRCVGCDHFRTDVSYDGPFTETKELVAGFWLIEVKSRDEAIEWVKRVPNPDAADSEIEIRQVFEADDFGPEFTPELREHEERLRAEVARSK